MSCTGEKHVKISCKNECTVLCNAGENHVKASCKNACTVLCNAGENHVKLSCDGFSTLINKNVGKLHEIIIWAHI